MPQGLNFFLPTWILVWLVIFGLIAILIGYRKAALILLAPPALHWLVFPAKSAIVENTSVWVQLAVSSIFVVFLLRAILSIIFGREIANQAIGHVVGTAITRTTGSITFFSKRLIILMRRGK